MNPVTTNDAAPASSPTPPPNNTTANDDDVAARTDASLFSASGRDLLAEVQRTFVKTEEDHNRMCNFFFVQNEIDVIKFTYVIFHYYRVTTNYKE